MHNSRCHKKVFAMSDPIFDIQQYNHLINSQISAIRFSSEDCFISTNTGAFYIYGDVLVQSSHASERMDLNTDQGKLEILKFMDLKIISISHEEGNYFKLSMENEGAILISMVTTGAIYDEDY